jgi:uncharacterized protein YciI
MHYLLIYELSADYLQKRDGFRPEHFRLAWEAQGRGELILAGALADPVDQAVLLFRGASAAVAEDFARADPYTKNHIVKSWRVRPWTTVVGTDATAPLHP